MQLRCSMSGSWNKAPVTPIDQARLDGLNFTANALLQAGINPSQLPGAMTEQKVVVERETKRKVAFKDGTTDGIWFLFEAKRGQGHLRVTKPNEVRFLTARIDGVVMSANLMKPGVYNHDNAHVAGALRILADTIENTHVRLADQDVVLQVEW
jgi:hypothetical protein